MVYFLKYGKYLVLYSSTTNSNLVKKMYEESVYVKVTIDLAYTRQENTRVLA